MATPTKIDIGAYAAGEIPPDLDVQFLDFKGLAVDLQGFDRFSMNIEAIPEVTGPLGAGTITMVNALEGRVRYSWTEDDMAEPSGYRAQLWVTDGTKRYASDLLLYTVYDGPGDAVTLVGGP